MIIVFCELGGENLLGKARELADSTGESVKAVSSENEKVDPRRLIYLGADEVFTFRVDSPGLWVDVMSNLIKRTEQRISCVIFPSNIQCNFIMGALYSRMTDRVFAYLDEAEIHDGSIISKPLETIGLALQKEIRQGGEGEEKAESGAEERKAPKICLLSLKVASLPSPFEDTSRSGRVTSVKPSLDSGYSPIPMDAPAKPLNSSSELTILVGTLCGEGIAGLAQRLGDKLSARILKYSGAIEVVYGPCIAIELEIKVRDLPEFKGLLISISSRNLPVNTVSDVSVVHEDIEEILKGLL